MKPSLKKFVDCVEWLTRFSGWIAAFCMVAAAVIVTEAVIVRKVFNVSTTWQIEASVFLLIFTVFIGAAMVQKNENHLNVDLVIIHLSPKTREITLVIVSILSLILVGIFVWYSWPMWWESYVHNERSESLWGPPLWIPYFFLPLGMTLLFFQYIVSILKRIEAILSGNIDKEAVRVELKDIDLDQAKK